MGERLLRYFTAPDGARIAYRDEGEGRPLVFLHGLMAHGGFFPGQDVLSEDFRLIRVDLRGHGESRQAGGTLTVAQLAGDVAALADALDLEEAIGIGWSLGASVFWEILCGPVRDRFAASVVVDMTARVENVDGWDLGLSPEACALRSAAIAADFTSFATAAGQAIFSQPIGPQCRATADWASAEFARNDPEVIGAIWQSLVAEDFRPLLARIEQPTLVIHGRHSQLYDAATAEYLVQTLPNAREIEFERSGHAPQLEQPEQFNAAIRDFAGRLGAAAPSITQKQRQRI